VEINDTGIDQCMKDNVFSLNLKFAKYFPEAVNDKYKCIVGHLHAYYPLPPITTVLSLSFSLS
jgi:hypothetical protein